MLGVGGACGGHGVVLLGGWLRVVAVLDRETPGAFVDCFGVGRVDGRDTDSVMYRHWVDPTVPFARTLASPAHGFVVTSATLTDRTGDAEAEWRVAGARTGAAHLPLPAVHSRHPLPFRYPDPAPVVLIHDGNTRSDGATSDSHETMAPSVGL